MSDCRIQSITYSKGSKSLCAWTNFGDKRGYLSVHHHHTASASTPSPNTPRSPPTKPERPLELTSLPTPSPALGSAIIRVLYAPIVSYTKSVLNGARAYPYPTPFVPGPSCVGRIAALGPDSTSFHLGQLVYVDSVVRSRDNPVDIFLLGATQGPTQGSAKLMREVWRNGTYAEYVDVPLENVYALDEEKLLGERGLGYTERELCTLTRYLVPYGGLRSIDVRVGERVVVTPATGAFGGAAVALALALGAAEVLAMGRNESSLRKLTEQFGERVKTVKITNDVAADTAALKHAAGGADIDAVFEISPRQAAESSLIRSAILALRHGGRVSLMGGILGDYAIPLRAIMRNDLTLKGKWMYSHSDVQSLIRMVETGRLAIGERNGVKIIDDYEFGDWEKAIDQAEEEATWNVQVVMHSSP